MYIMSRKELYTKSEIKEFENADFLNCITGVIMQDSESSDFYIKIYELVYLENGKILRTSGKFQGAVQRAVRIALVRCYDIKQLEPEVYSCSHLYYTEEYNTIPIGSIN
ncbi:hypothetical protein C1645_735566 [Glomus cerebriforme]|uniref:Uncharacterized protein n=1 Tax=Glomus cerebriforme TaxID=658196 RepID=A0A397TB19_9GLOM|nr:hypothetical protein C1645_735566 [Glomus cerebriforme]